MKVYLLKDIVGVGVCGEIVKVKEGYADNFLLPRKVAIKITKQNELFYSSRAKQVDNRKDVIASKTSLLAEKIKDLKLSLKRKMHDDGKLYGSIHASEIVDLLAQEGVNVSKKQIKLDKAIKEKGSFEIVIKLTSKLQTKFQLKVLPENASA